MSVPDGNILVTATHVVILFTAVVGAISSVLNRKKLNKIEVIINGGLSDAIKAAIKKEVDRP